MGCFSGPSSQATRVDKLTPAQQQLIAQLSKQAQPAIQNVTGATIPGQEFAPLGPSGLQQQGIGLAGQFAPAIEAGAGGFDPQAIMSALEPGRQLALNTFNQDIVPNLLERFGATSGESGPLNKQLAETGANLSLGLGAQAAPFLGQGALQAPGFASSALSQMLGVGGLQGSFPEAQRQFGLQNFMAGAPEADPRLGFIGPAFTAAFDTAVQQRGAGVGSQALSAFAQAVSGTNFG